ncbi:MAG: hypothetical protein MMC23_003926 [Stictis urceolatum]|nr:hypothetical protein [Stictis urceolata]
MPASAAPDPLRHQGHDYLEYAERMDNGGLAQPNDVLSTKSNLARILSMWKRFCKEIK